MLLLIVPTTFFILQFHSNGYSQSCVPTNLNNSTINLSCGTPCTRLSFQVPHLKSTSTYAFNAIPYAPLTYIVTTGGVEDPLLYNDDKFSSVFQLPFAFCFYDSNYSKVIIGSNGLITFDETNQSCDNAYEINGTIPGAASDVQCSQFSEYYPRAAIMAVYSDLFPTIAGSPAGMKIQWRIEGMAPCRKFVVSFFKVGTFGNTLCSNTTPNTFQIILYESTGLVDIFIENKTCFSTSANLGAAILGMQNWDRNAAVAAPGKNATRWSSVNEGYRFTPNGGTSKFVSSQLLNMAGTVLAAADTATTVAGLLNISFPNICPLPGATQYVVRTTFASCPTGGNLISLDTVTVSRNNTLPVTTVITPTTCGNSAGAITVNVATGIGTTPYLFSLNAGTPQTSNVFSNLAAGTYMVLATDATGCDTSYLVNIVASSSLISTVTSTNAICPGLNNGSITVTPTSGTAPYTFSSNGGTTQATGAFINLTAGSYTIVFTDALLCTGSVTVAVAPGTAITANSTSTATSCAGASDGTITVTPTSGVSPYTFSLDGGAFLPANIFSGVSSGTHSIVVKDSRGCTVTISRLVAAGSSLTGNIFSTALSCPGANNGTVTLVPTNGLAPYSFRIDGGPAQATGTFTGLTAGLHTVIFNDANGCSGSGSIIVGPGTGSSTGSFSTSTSCPGGFDGIITITPVTGAVYTLNPGNITNTTGIFTGLAAGTYSANFVVPPSTCVGTVAPAGIVVGSGPTLSGTANGGSTSCATGNDGTITVTSPNTAGTIFTLNPGGVTSSTGIFTGLAPGTYAINFLTAAGCAGTVTSNPVVTAGSVLSSTFTQANPACANVNDGSISIIPQAGAAAPFTVTLTGPGGPYNTTSNSPIVFNNLAPGNYSFIYFSANGCTGPGANVLLTSNNALLTPALITMPLCNGAANGTVTFSPIGGAGPYQYSSDGGVTYQASRGFGGLAAAPHSFRIKDNVGCIKDTTIVLTQPTLLSANALSNATAGCGNNDGSVTATALGGTNPYAYTIAGPTVNTSGAINGIFTGLGPGNYTVTVTDTKGCTKTATAIVTSVDNMFLNAGRDTTVCMESSVTFNVKTNFGTSIFAWRSNDAPPGTISNPGAKNATVSPTDTATFILNATWGTCVRDDTIKVNVLRKPNANAGKDTAICDISFATLRGSATNLSGTVNYKWSPITGSPALGVDPTKSTTNVYPPGNNTTYVYTLTITDNYNCKFNVTDQVSVRVQPPVPANAGMDTTAIKGVAHQLYGSGGTSYIWSPASLLNNAIIQNPIVTLQNDTRFELRVTDPAGCIGYDSVFVKVYLGPAYYIPNAFSPNGDGQNDVFRAIPVGIANTEWFRIFNRYGQMVFQTNAWMKGWDGTYKGKKQPIGAYVWIIKGTDKNGKPVEMKGTVMLVQ